MSVKEESKMDHRRLFKHVINRREREMTSKSAARFAQARAVAKAVAADSSKSVKFVLESKQSSVSLDQTVIVLEDEYGEAIKDDLQAAETVFESLELEKKAAVMKMASHNPRRILKVGDLRVRSPANIKLIEVAWKNPDAKFVKLPDICVGTFQRERFRQDDGGKPFFTQLVRKEAVVLCDVLLKKTIYDRPLYLYGNVGIGKSYVLYQTACRLLPKRENHRVVYVNQAKPSTIHSDYALSLASVLDDTATDSEALGIIMTLFDEDGYLKRKSKDEMACAIHWCKKALIKKGIQVISIIDQTDSIQEKDKEAYTFVARSLSSSSICLFAGSDDDDIITQRRRKLETTSLLPVQISIDDMKHLIHQLHPHVAVQIAGSKSVLELCHAITGGTMLEISRLCNLTKEDIFPSGLTAKDMKALEITADDLKLDTIQKRLKLYPVAYQRAFNSSMHAKYLSHENHSIKTFRRASMDASITSALLGQPLRSIYVHAYIDTRFMYKFRTPDGIKANFLNPYSIECLQSHYKFAELKSLCMELGFFNLFLTNSTKDFLFEHLIITALRILNASSPRRPLDLLIHSNNENKPASVAELRFINCDIVQIYEGLSLEHINSKKNCLMLPVSSKNSAFNIYYYERTEKTIFCLQFTTAQNMAEKMAKIRTKFPQEMAELRETFGQAVDFYIIYMTDRECEKDLVRKFPKLNYALYEELNLGFDKFNEALTYIVDKPVMATEHAAIVPLDTTPPNKRQKIEA